MSETTGAPARSRRPSKQSAEGPTKSDRVRALAEGALAELSDSLAAGDSERLRRYLAAVGRFHNYSFNNVLLIMCQKPEATRVAGFHTWRKLGRHVKKGETGIAIFAPMLVRARDDKNEPDDEAPKQLRFRVVHVFDVGQTEGEPLLEFARAGGDPGIYAERLESAVASRGIELTESDALGGALGVSKGGTIVLQAGLDPAERFQTLAHELAHELLHKVPAEDKPSKLVRETEAEAVAYIVGSSIGLEAGDASTDYIRLYRGDAETLAASLDRIQKTACEILDAILDDQPSNSPPQRVTATPGRGRSR